MREKKFDKVIDDVYEILYLDLFMLWGYRFFVFKFWV